MGGNNDRMAKAKATKEARLALLERSYHEANGDIDEGYRALVRICMQKLGTPRPWLSRIAYRRRIQRMLRNGRL